MNCAARPPAGHMILCHGMCGQVLDVSNFGASQLKKAHPRCKACATNKFSNQRSAQGASKFESRRGRDLVVQERAGAIRDLRAQVPFVLLEKQFDAAGKLLEREVIYIADYTYTVVDENRFVVEDAKGMRTKEYVLKRKLMLAVHKIRIQEVHA